MQLSRLFQWLKNFLALCMPYINLVQLPVLVFSAYPLYVQVVSFSSLVNEQIKLMLVYGADFA